MRTSLKIAAASAFLLGAAIATGGAAFAADKPVPIRLGTTTTSGEDQLWLMKARPDLTPNQGKAYTLETFPFRGGDLRFKAFQAGQVDGAVSTGTGALTAATKGVRLVIVAALSEEDDAVYSTPYVVMDNSPIKTVKDLKGKSIGLNGLREAVELGARMAVMDAGLNPDRDVNWVIVSPPTMGDALRRGKVDIGFLPQPFFAAEKARGGIRTLFTHNAATGFKDEFVLFFNPDFIKAHPDTMRAFISDFLGATKYYIEHTREARKSISDAKIITMDPKIYLPMVALKRKEDGKPSRDYVVALQKALIRVGYVDRAIDIDSVIDTSMFPK
jgi:ABC-type nitrate/sulfonate/bicarbonate transport system substrate-binding protein